MTMTAAIIRSGERVGLLRYRLEEKDWRQMLNDQGSALPLISAWADEEEVTALFLDGASPLMASTAVRKGRYLALSSRFPAAAWGERVACDLWGVEAMHARDDSPALDEGGWAMTRPLSQRAIAVSGGLSALSAPPELSHEHSGLTGLLGVSYVLQRRHVRHPAFHVGPSHRGLVALIRGKTPKEALKLVSRVTAGGFVAHPLAFVRAVEQARGQSPGPGLRDRRFLLLEIERISLHLHDMAMTARCTGADLFAAHCDDLREKIAELCATHHLPRRLTDTIDFTCGDEMEPVPLAQAVHQALSQRLTLLADLQRLFMPRLSGVGVLSARDARDYAIGGPPGRASGRHLDMRQRDSGMRLDALRSTGLSEGDAAARDLMRLAEIRESLALIRRIVASIGVDDGGRAVSGRGEGLGVAEGARGDVWYWVTLKNGRIDKLHIRDPSEALLSVMGTVLHQTPPERLVLALRSFGVSPAGVAL